MAGSDDQFEEHAPLLCPPEDEAGPSGTRTLQENTPLLAGGNEQPALHEDDESAAPQPKKRAVFGRWPSFIAITLLAASLIAILVFVYFIPATIEDYAKQGVVVEPTNLSLESITTDGVRARIQANFRLDGSRVKDDNVRRIGRALTWIVGQLGIEETTVHAFLPDYGNVLLGSAVIPPLAVSLVDGHTTAIDFVADLSLGDADGIRSIANQWLEGQLDSLRVQGMAEIQLKSGVIPLGTHTVSESLAFEASDLPSIPQYSIDRINFEETRVPGNEDSAMGAQVSISAFNEFPFQLDIPSLGFEILVPDCNPSDSYIVVADAITEPIEVRPQSLVVVEVNGTIQELPESLVTQCPGSESSPLDLLLKQYMSGEEATIFVTGSKKHSDSTPGWISDILSSVTLPIPFPGRTFDNLIRNFSMTDVKFTMPDPMAEPGDPGANPTVSGTILVTAGMPSEMNFAVNVTQVRANADVLYASNKLGELHLQKWQAANSTLSRATEDHEATLTIQSHIEDAPLIVTDGDVLTDVIQKLLFGSSDVSLDINALVDIRIDTVLGQFALKDVPASGNVPVQPLPRGSIGSIAPKVDSIEILDTTETSITLEAVVNVTNPTEYSAHVPLVRMDVLCNDTIIGAVQAENLDIKTGNNTNLVVRATWNPALGGEHGAQIGRDLLSQYISGFNTSITAKAHRNSFPLQPLLGLALSKFNFIVPTPRLRLPGVDEDDPKKHSFIRSAVFHVLTSRASFNLLSPLQKKTLHIEAVHATAFYNHTELVGTITSRIPISVPPGLSETPKLPVKWTPDSVGFDKIRQALGGELRLDAEAEVQVRLDAWQETLWYVGHGIGAHVRP